MMVILSSLGVGVLFFLSKLRDILNRQCPGNFPRLIIWDTRNPENSDNKTLSLKQCLGDPGVLDMTWSRDNACALLIVLTSSGEHLTFPTYQHESLAGNQICFKDITEGLTVTAHSSQTSFKYGSITSFESAIASTVGSEVFLRDMESSTFFLVITISNVNGLQKLQPSWLLHLPTIFRCLMSLESHTFILCQEHDSLSFLCKSLKCT